MAELLRDTSLDDEQIEYVAIFQRCGNSLLGLLDNVLELARIESDEVEIAREPFDLHELIEDIAQTFGYPAHKKRLALVCDLRPGVPRWVVGDGGRLRPGRREDLLVRRSPVHYEPDARSPAWERFLAETFVHEPELPAFVQRMIGYALTGETCEEVLFFLYGPTASGKSTFLEAVKAVLGDYARTADFGTFLRRSCDELGQTIVVVTHDPKAASFADRIVFLKDGQIASEIKLERGGDTAPILERLGELA